MFSIHRELTDYFGSYVAGVRLHLSGDHDVVALSVHARPTRVLQPDIERWPAAFPVGRVAAEGVLHPVCYNDLVLALIAEVAEAFPVIAAGDYNEARSRALTAVRLLPERARFGEEYFERATALGLVDVTFQHWREERRTLYHRRTFGVMSGPESSAPFQSDHVLATEDVAARIHAPITDPAWNDPERRRHHSDHAPIWFKIRI